MDIQHIDWVNSVNLCEQLAASISHRPDTIVGLSRGGLVSARILADFLQIRHIFVLGISLYDGIDKKGKKPKIIQTLPSSAIKGKKVLLVDDVADSGLSLALAKEYLLKKGASELKIATIHYKPGSIIKPDYFVSTTQAWIVYPWEVHEFEKDKNK